LGFAGGYFRARLSRELAPLTVYVYSDLGEIAAAYSQALGVSIEEARRRWSSPDLGANAPPGKIFMYVPPSGYGGDANLTKVVVHEAFHNLQTTLLGGTIEPTDGPVWLIEGSAEYIAYQTIATYGLDSLENIRRSRIERVKTTSAPLRSLETYAGFTPQNSPYPLSALAGERLAAANGGETVFIAYFEAVAQGAAWSEAFRTVFGRTVDTFYAEFEAYRSGL